MRKHNIIIIAFLYIFLNANAVFATVNIWMQKDDFGGTVRDAPVGFSMESKGYIGTGSYVVISGGCVIGDGGGITCSPLIQTFIYLNDFWEYDSVSDTWTQKADFGGAGRAFAVGFSIGSKGYIGTGYDGSSRRNDFWEYDPASNTWTQKADFGGAVRDSAVGFSIGSKGYIGTGYDGSSRRNDFWEYDPASNTWTQKADFGGAARNSAAGFSIGRKGYIGTGYDTSSRRNDFWEYDPASNTWTQKADFGGTARNSAVGFSIGNKGYIGTGEDISSVGLKDFWEYDPTSNTWTQKSDFGGTGRSYASGFSIGSKGYIGTSSSSKDFWEYEAPDTIPDQFTFTAQTGMSPNTVVTSNTITVSGIAAAASISITGGAYAINGDLYTSAVGTVNNGDTITVQQTSSGSYSTTTDTMLTIGGVSDTFSVTTQAAPAGGSGGGCFIATAAFGSPIERHVQILRDFRDRYLLKFKLGQKFVKLYYRISPPIADNISKNKLLRMITRWCLAPVIGVAYLINLLGMISTSLIITACFMILFSFVRLFRKKYKRELEDSSAILFKKY